MGTSCRHALNRSHPWVRLFGVKTLAVLFFCTVLFPVNSPVLASTRQDITMPDIDFPIYPSIKPNVAFWIDIFTKYTKSQGVIHDTRNLDVVYTVVRLDASETAHAARKNKKIKTAVTKKYKTILLHLSTSPAALSAEEKRVADMFGPHATPKDFKDAASRIRCQTGLKKEFRDGLVRSGAVIDEFKKIFRSHGLPVDLVYLPCVESSYNFKAYSKFGAAGIWQFTHGTGRQYMTINYVVDERRDPFISTDAAARLLKKNYAALGEWPLAMTAYNHGLAGMMRAQKAKGSYEKIVQSYRSRTFKFASRNFYSEFLAARIVAKNMDKYFQDIEFHSPVRFQTIKTKGFLPVEKLADRLNISVREIRSLNPSLRSPVFNGQKHIPKGFNLKLPHSVVTPETKDHLAALYLTKQNPSRFHTVRKGDTAGSIARTHSVGLQDLILANGLNRRAVIYIGQNLRIPVKDELIPAAKEPRAARPKKQPRKMIAKKETSPAAGPVVSLEPAPPAGPAASPEPSASPGQGTPPVQEADPGQAAPLPEQIASTEPMPWTGPPPSPGAPTSPGAQSAVEPPTVPETLTPATPSDSSKPLASTGLLASIEPAPLPGKRVPGPSVEPVITIEAADTAAIPVAEETVINPNIITGNLSVLSTYTEKNRLIGVIKVEAEETLGHYADWLQVPTQKLRVLNGFKYSTPISIDQTIKIPLGKKTVREFEEQRYEFHKEIEEDFFESFFVQGVDTYEVKNGDTIWSLCLNELEIPFWLLKKYNPGMGFTSLFPSQKIKYPLISKRREE